MLIDSMWLEKGQKELKRRYVLLNDRMNNEEDKANV